jgi:3-oxoacyl-[acyl-carrier protein] reductase
MNHIQRTRVAIVTGAGRGIGRAIALKLASGGCKVVLVDLEDPSATAAQIGDAALSVTADVSRDDEWERIADTAEKHFGTVNIVVNNAAIYPMATIDDLDIDVWRKTFAVNLEAHFFSAKHLVPRMRIHRWGRFINISSNSIGIALPGLSHYMSSKMGVIGFVRGLANDVACDGITVNAILPSLTNTPGTSGFPEEFKRSVWEQQAIKRFADPEDIAGPVAFLSSDDAAFITGQAIVVDGGQYKIS